MNTTPYIIYILLLVALAGCAVLSMLCLRYKREADMLRGLEEAYGIPCHIDNDVKSATRAERLWEFGQISKNFVYLNVGTGIAVGTVINGRQIRGSHFNAGEVGHLRVGVQVGVKCACGRMDCVEAIAAGIGFDNCARLLRSRYETRLHIPDEREGRVLVSEVFTLAQKGDPLCVALVDIASEALANLIMNLGLGLFFLSSWFTVRFPEAAWRAGESVVPYGFLIFLIGSFVVGASATILQVVINPYLTACYVRGTQPIQRLAIGGSANSVGTTLAPYFVTGVVFGGLSMSEIRIDQLMLPFFSLMVVIMLVVFLLMRFSLPDVQGTKAEAGEKLERSVWSFRHLALGVVAIFFYVGVEVCIGGNINLYAMEMGMASPALLATLYWGGMLVGRLVGSSLSHVSPRTQLTVTTTLAGVLTVLAIAFDNPWLLCAVGLFHSIMWGAIFTLSVARLGKYTSAASGVFMIGVVGGAVFPLLQGVLADVLGGWRLSWCLVVAGEAFMLWYALMGSRIRPKDVVV